MARKKKLRRREKLFSYNQISGLAADSRPTVSQFWSLRIRPLETSTNGFFEALALKKGWPGCLLRMQLGELKFMKGEKKKENKKNKQMKNQEIIELCSYARPKIDWQQFFSRYFPPNIDFHRGKIEIKKTHLI